MIFNDVNIGDQLEVIKGTDYTARLMEADSDNHKYFRRLVKGTVITIEDKGCRTSKCVRGTFSGGKLVYFTIKGTRCFARWIDVKKHMRKVCIKN